MVEVDWKEGKGKELAQSTVRVNCYGPSFVDFDLVRNISRDQIVRQALLSMIKEKKYPQNTAIESLSKTV